MVYGLFLFSFSCPSGFVKAADRFLSIVFSDFVKAENPVTATHTGLFSTLDLLLAAKFHHELIVDVGVAHCLESIA